MKHWKIALKSIILTKIVSVFSEAYLKMHIETTQTWALVEIFTYIKSH